MHPDFADWYSIASINPNDVDLKARWAGVETLVSTSTTTTLLETTRLFFGLPLKDAAFLGRFRAPFKTEDEKFSMLDGNVELRVLAGATLIAELDDTDLSDSAALLLTCTSFRDQRGAPVGDIVRLGREFVFNAAAKLREREAVAPPNSDDIGTKLTNAVNAARSALKTAADPATTAPIGGALDELAKAIVSLTEWAHDMREEREMRREESDVLWWLFAEQSRDLKIPYAKLSLPAAALVAAKEMSDLTRTTLPPFAAAGFLDKAIGSAKGGKKGDQITLADAVDACPAPWRKEASERREIDAIADLCPVMFALRKAVEAGGKKTWVEVFSNVTGLKATTPIAPRELAQQAYEEWLLARSIASLVPTEKA